MQISTVAQLTSQGVKSIEVHEPAFRLLKEQFTGMFEKGTPLPFKKEDGIESIVIFGVKVWFKPDSGIIVN